MLKWYLIRYAIMYFDLRYIDYISIIMYDGNMIMI